MTPAKDSQALDVFGAIVEFMTPEDDRQFCVMRVVMPPGTMVPLHSHEDFGDFYVVAGRYEVLVQNDGSMDWRDTQAGDYIRVPGDVVHALRNISEEPAVNLVITTARMGSFFREVGRPAGSPPPTAQDLARFAEIAGRYGYRLATPEENAAVGIPSTLTA
ncbi:cupin domain-containing protein [Mycobacterium branderi]|uniref:Cupin n=1 Tax=Mycobacterium branderi TaxID=43348 RepID=A0A7I7W7T7_9MYCO|nr:cupin domain-containing protein [Mycobacterium branderi]MCV7236474.1 cupin domain-containing protein [Mycobacterium branderi]ORA36758.1 cupin [Mycobacterium branderi]BBZ13639.1 cupin [Mycobacterium branderi]